jgi:hypothetical protein
VTDLVSIVHWGPTGVTRIWTGPSGIVTVALCGCAAKIEV